MIYVYLLQSHTASDQRYVGLTTDLKQRLTEHAFPNQLKATTFERYLKSGSGQGLCSKTPVVKDGVIRARLDLRCAL
jgi:putative endonuclease